MSERGSFVTEYLYCRNCFEALKEVLCQRIKYLCGTAIPTWEEKGGELPIIAGKVGGLYAGEELDFFDQDLRKEIERTICCDVVIVVIPDSAQPATFTFTPTNEEKKP